MKRLLPIGTTLYTIIESISDRMNTPMRKHVCASRTRVRTRAYIYMCV